MRYVLLTAGTVAILLLSAGVPAKDIRANRGLTRSTAPATTSAPADPVESPLPRPVLLTDLAGPAPAAPTAPAPTSAPSRPKGPRPTGDPGAPGLASCVTAECHGDVKDFKVLHGPVNVNACDACHKLTDPKKHTYALTRGKTEICTFCHKMDAPLEAVVHKPIKDGDCLPCHNPHGAANGSFLRGATMNDLCKSCHKDVLAGRKMPHGPVAAGACGACHAAHSAPYPKLLSAQGSDLCLNCHTQMKVQMKQARFTHKAVQTDCLSCHEAHASNYPMQTKQPPLELCTSCHDHDNVKKAALESPFKHSVVTQDLACLNCHTAHGGDLAKLMKSQPIQVCMKCHDKKIESGGRTIAAVPEVLDTGTNKHGPVREGNCDGCHTVHGGTVGGLLSEPYPQKFYEAFEPEKYALCFRCHDKQLALMRQTRTVTTFRNGDLNLHYLHVNKPRQGRSCRACHSTHASTNAMHVCQSVPFGNWQMPINFTPTGTGGRCASGCHRELSYDREKPVELKSATQPAATAAPPSARQVIPATGGIAPGTQPAVPTTKESGR